MLVVLLIAWPGPYAVGFRWSDCSHGLLDADGSERDVTTGVALDVGADGSGWAVGVSILKLNVRALVVIGVVARGRFEVGCVARERNDVLMDDLGGGVVAMRAFTAAPLARERVYDRVEHANLT